MARKFAIVPTTFSEKVLTTRIGTAAAPLTQADIGKAVKLIGDSQYDLCSATDPIEGYLQSSNLESQGTVDGFAIGGVVRTGMKTAVVVGATVVAGDYVKAAAQPAKGTKLTYLNQATPVTKDAGATPGAGRNLARVMSLLDGNGSAGTFITIELLP